MARTELRNHPKFKRLVKRLDLPAPYVTGLLETMWHVSYESGSAKLGKSEDVELAAEWPGQAGLFFEAVRSDWLDEFEGEFYVHDLNDHAPDYVRKKLERRRNKYLEKETAANVRRSAVNGPMTSNRQVTDTDTQNKSSDAESFFEDLSRVPYPLFPVAAKASRSNTWRLPDALASELAATYPAVDVPAQCRKAWQWVKTNLGRRKTAAGMPKFLNTWMARQQDCGGFKNGPATAANSRVDEQRRKLAAVTGGSENGAQ